jgi:hypothetical protein
VRSSPMDAQDERGASPRRDRARLVAQLSDLDGRRYLRLINQLASHPTHFRELNVTFAASLLYSLALQARLTHADAPPIPSLDPPVFIEDLLDAVEAVLRA